MNFEDLKYLVDQIIGHLSEARNQQHVERRLEDIRKAVNIPLMKRTKKWERVCNKLSCLSTPNYKSKYPPSKNLHFNINEVISYEKKNVLFSQLIISNDIREIIRLNVRWTPYGSREHVKQLRKDFYRWEKYFYGCKFSLVSCPEVDNLIVVGPEPRGEFDEICLQAGIYLLRNKILEKQAWWDLYQLFEKVLKQFGVYKRIEELGLSTDEAFQKIIDTYKIPFDVSSFKTYLKDHMYGLRYKEFRKAERWQGFPKQSVYTLIRRGKVHVKKRFGRYVYDGDLYEQVKSLKEEKGKWQDLTKLLASKRNISYKSAQRSIQKWKKEGLSLEEIEEKVKTAKPRHK